MPYIEKDFLNEELIGTHSNWDNENAKIKDDIFILSQDTDVIKKGKDLKTYIELEEIININDINIIDTVYSDYISVLLGTNISPKIAFFDEDMIVNRTNISEDDIDLNQFNSEFIELSSTMIPLINGPLRKRYGTSFSLKADSISSYRDKGGYIETYEWTLPDASVQTGEEIVISLDNDPNLIGTALLYSCQATDILGNKSEISYFTVIVADNDYPIVIPNWILIGNNPIIDNFFWNNNNHQENETYDLTIIASDPLGLNLTYQLYCNNPNVSVVQDGIDDNIFHVTYPDYDIDTTVMYTIKVTNEYQYKAIKTDTKLIETINPSINGFLWSNDNHEESGSYDLTIDASDPNSEDLTYEVECDDSNVTIVQDGINEALFHITYPEYDIDTIVTYTITVTNESLLTDIETNVKIVAYIQANPVINSLVWNDNNHEENEIYDLTINASDENNQDLTYEVECDDPNVDIVQDGINDYIFHVTYPEYTEDTTVTYTITVTNEDLLTDIETDVKVVANVPANPVINSLVWNDEDHEENETYDLTINATDPNSEDLTYEVECDDVNVTIVQDGTDETIFHVTYPEYTEDTTVTYTITVINESLLTDVETDVKVVVDIPTNPVINSLVWSNDNHEESGSYDLTINATDPQSQDLTYEVECDDSNVIIVQDGINETLFHITYPEYDIDTTVTYTITVTNEDLLTDIETDIKVVAYIPANPVINSLVWNDNNHVESGSYNLTINASDENNQNLTYQVGCDDINITINQDGIDETLFHVTYPEYDVDTTITYTVTVTNEDSLTDVETDIKVVAYIQANPVINSLIWSNENHEENETYDLTVNATDENNQDLTYEIECDDVNVTIVQDGTDETLFHITYPEYTEDTTVTYTITVTNEDSLTDIETDVKVVANVPANPVINSLIWSNENHEENETYDLTVNATDPNSEDLTYEVECDDVNVTIVQDGTDETLFHVTYPEYTEDTTVTYTITVTNESLLADVETDIKIVANVPVSGDRGIFAGGNIGSMTDVIDYIIISSAPSNAINFGNLSVTRDRLSATSNGINGRGVFAGGGSNPFFNEIDYITISILGNAVDFGDLSVDRGRLVATSNGTNERGIFGGGTVPNDVDTIEYITISNIGNAADFGDLTLARRNPGGTSNGINDRGVFGGGMLSSQRNIIDYVTISNVGNAVDFGDLTRARNALAACSNGVNDRGVFGGGYSNGHLNKIDYITISILGNAADFGDLTIARYILSATSNGTNDRGVFGGGHSNSPLDIIDYITISTPGNALDFGDLTVGREKLAACSDA